MAAPMLRGRSGQSVRCYRDSSRSAAHRASLARSGPSCSAAANAPSKSKIACAGFLVSRAVYSAPAWPATRGALCAVWPVQTNNILVPLAETPKNLVRFRLDSRDLRCGPNEPRKFPDAPDSERVLQNPYATTRKELPTCTT